MHLCGDTVYYSSQHNTSKETIETFLGTTPVSEWKTTGAACRKDFRNRETMNMGIEYACSNTRKTSDYAEKHAPLHSSLRMHSG